MNRDKRGLCRISRGSVIENLYKIKIEQREYNKECREEKVEKENVELRDYRYYSYKIRIKVLNRVE